MPVELIVLGQVPHLDLNEAHPVVCFIPDIVILFTLFIRPW